MIPILIVRLQIINPFIVNANFENYSEIYLSDLPEKIGVQIDNLDNKMSGDTINYIKYRKLDDPEFKLRFDTADLGLAAIRAGYDCLIVENVMDAGNKSALNIFQTTYAVFNPSLISINNIYTEVYA